MNLVQKIIEKRKIKKSKYYLDYLTCRDILKVDINRFNKYYNDALITIRGLLDAGVPADDKRVVSAKEEMQRWYYEYQEAVVAKDYLRPNTNEDILERQGIFENFGEELKNILGEDSKIRFHGTPIYFAKSIIETGTISSTADRFEGYIRSTDLRGTFSASTINTLPTTIDYFMDIGSDRRSLPCGALFVLQEREYDEQLREQSCMYNTNFKTDPDQLVAIVSTTENKSALIKWCNDYGLDSNKVYTFGEFLEYAKNNNIESSIKL